MNTQHRRFIFIDFENLRKVKFKKLEKVATKIFVFVNAEITHIPSHLVFQMQKLGKDVKWIIVDKPVDNRMNYHIAFLMGKLHEKLHGDVEFAVLSNDNDFDPLISFINSQGRNCIRVKRKKTKEEKELDLLLDIELEPSVPNHSNGQNIVQEAPPAKEARQTVSIIETEYDKLLVEKTAEETIERLVRSGNRPAKVATLKHYILLHNQELSVHSNIDQVIQKMEENKGIEIAPEGHVRYHF